MNINTTDIRDKLVQNNLKVTPQRLAVLETVLNLKTHPTTEQIIAVIKRNAGDYSNRYTKNTFSVIIQLYI